MQVGAKFLFGQDNTINTLVVSILSLRSQWIKNTKGTSSGEQEFYTYYNLCPLLDGSDPTVGGRG
jgi:hypothetical protein